MRKSIEDALKPGIAKSGLELTPSAYLDYLSTHLAIVNDAVDASARVDGGTALSATADYALELCRSVLRNIVNS